MRWSEAGYLSRIVLAHAPRQVSVSLILDVRQKKTMHDENAREAILEVVANQLKLGVAPEVLAEFNRLVAEGISKQKAKELIGMILACHVASSMKHSRNFDYRAYINELKKLPRYNLDREL